MQQKVLAVWILDSTTISGIAKANDKQQTVELLLKVIIFKRLNKNLCLKHSA